MRADTPEEIHRLWAEAYNRGDLEALLGLYEAESALVPQPGQAPVAGTGAIREALQSFLSQKGQLTIEIETAYAIRAGELALLSSRWRLNDRSRGGVTVTTHKSAEIVRRQPDGSWRYVLDHPFGAD